MIDHTGTLTICAIFQDQATANCQITSIHQFSVTAYPAHRVTGVLEPIPAILGRSRGRPTTPGQASLSQGHGA